MEYRCAREPQKLHYRSFCAWEPQKLRFWSFCARSAPENLVLYKIRWSIAVHGNLRNSVFGVSAHGVRQKTSFSIRYGGVSLRTGTSKTPLPEFLHSTVPYRERGFLAHSVRRNSKNGVSEVPMRRNSGCGVFEVPVRSDTPPYLIENEVFWCTPWAETPKTEFLRIPCAIIPLLDDMWRGRRRSISGSLI